MTKAEGGSSSSAASTPESEDRPELLTLHQVHVAEYRFQVELNWKRSQYFLAINLAVLAAGGGLLGGSSSAGELVVAAAVFSAGISVAVLAHRIISWQHDYYRNARDRLRYIEKDLRLGDHGIATTPGMGGTHVPKGRITPMLRTTVAVLGVLNGIGLLAALFQLLCGENLSP